MDDLISRQAAIKAADAIISRDTSGNNDVVKAMTAWKHYINGLPSAHPDLDETCEDCKEYDSERHCCPRFSRVIRTTVEEMRQAAKTEPNTVSYRNFKENTDLISKIFDDDKQVYIVPERRIGHWIEDGYSHYKAVCDQCGEPCGTYAAGKPRDRFCKWCGADMRGEQDNIPMEYFESGGR